MKVNISESYEIELALIEEIETKYHPDSKAYFLQVTPPRPKNWPKQRRIWTSNWVKKWQKKE